MFTRIEEEKITVERMIRLYCYKKEGNHALCHECHELLNYAHTRLSRCKFGEAKPTCRLCEKHCYKLAMKHKMREVMRFSGPRMLLYFPKDAIKHLWREYINCKLK